MKLKKKLALASALSMMFILSACNKGTDVSLNVKKGDKYNMHVLNEETTSVVASAIVPSLQEVKLTKIADLNLVVDVKDVDSDKNITLNYKYDEIKCLQKLMAKKNNSTAKVMITVLKYVCIKLL